MKKVIPDNVVFDEENGYNASLLNYPTSVGSPVIKIDNLVSWKSRGISNVNKQFENKFNEYLMTKLRTVEGIDLNYIDSINSTWKSENNKTRHNRARLRASKHGWA